MKAGNGGEAANEPIDEEAEFESRGGTDSSGRNLLDNVSPEWVSGLSSATANHISLRLLAMLVSPDTL